MISKWKRSCAIAETPRLVAETPWGPSDSDSEAVGLQHLAYRNLRAFPISGDEFQNSGNPAAEEGGGGKVKVLGEDG